MTQKRERRFGKLSIHSDFFDKADEIGLSLLFSRFFPFRCEHNFCRNAFEYEGYCKDFEVVEEGFSPPAYQVWFQTRSNPTMPPKITFTKIEVK